MNNIAILRGQNKKKTHIMMSLFLWWSNGDSNPGPPACKAGALANWAIAPYRLFEKYLVGDEGLEPPTSSLSVTRSNQLS